MKKLFMFLAVAGLATFGASCSSDDNSTPPPPPPGGKQLTLSADKTSIEPGQAVTFTVKVDKEVVEADLYIQGTTETKISKTHTFAEEGTFKVIAKKADHKESSVVTITVKKGAEPEKKKLSLLVDNEAADLGETVTFTVLEGSANVTADAKIYLNGTTLIEGSTFKATEEGTYKFVAKKEGALDSDEVTVTFTEKLVIPEGIARVAYEGENVDGVTLKVGLHVDEEGQVIGYNVGGTTMTVWEFNFFDAAKNTDIVWLIGVPVANGSIVVPGMPNAEYALLRGGYNKFKGTTLPAGEISGFDMIINEMLHPDLYDTTDNVMEGVGVIAFGQKRLSFAYNKSFAFETLAQAPAANGIKAANRTLQALQVGKVSIK